MWQTPRVLCGGVGGSYLVVRAGGGAAVGGQLAGGAREARPALAGRVGLAARAAVAAAARAAALRRRARDTRGRARRRVAAEPRPARLTVATESHGLKDHYSLNGLVTRNFITHYIVFRDLFFYGQIFNRE